MANPRDGHEDYTHSGYVIPGDYMFLNFCVGNVGQGVEEQVNGAFDDMERHRLSREAILWTGQSSTEHL